MLGDEDEETADNSKKLQGCGPEHGAYHPKLAYVSPRPYLPTSSMHGSIRSENAASAMSTLPPRQSDGCRVKCWRLRGGEPSMVSPSPTDFPVNDDRADDGVNSKLWCQEVKKIL
eukprot:s990_g25.t1